MNSKTKTREGVSELNIDPNDKRSRLTKSNKEKADVLGQFFSSVFTAEPDGDIPYKEPSVVTEVMQELLSRREWYMTYLGTSMSINQ